MKLTEKYWLAGVIDSEGSIYINKIKEKRNKRGYQLVPVLTVSNTNTRLLKRVKEITKKGSIILTRTGRKNWKDNYHYFASANVIRKILKEIEPYLIVKREQSILMQKFLSLQNHKRYMDNYPIRIIKIHQRMKKLNRKGKRIED